MHVILSNLIFSLILPLFPNKQHTVFLDQLQTTKKSNLNFFQFLFTEGGRLLNLHLNNNQDLVGAMVVNGSVGCSDMNW